MCGRFTLQGPVGNLVGAPMGFVEESRYNIAPGQWVIVVRPDRHHAKAAGIARWGLVPSWAKDPEAGPKPINARAEGIAEKPTFRGAFRHGRCIIPASGFFEWKQVGKTKVPHYIRPKDGGFFLFAGLWSSWAGPEGELDTCTIITTTPNQIMEEIHNRMPVILAPEAIDTWMNAETKPTDALAMLRPCPEDWLDAFAVGPEVGNVRNDHPGLIERV